jgi:hypothetical protein
MIESPDVPADKDEAVAVDRGREDAGTVEDDLPDSDLDGEGRDWGGLGFKFRMTTGGMEDLMDELLQSDEECDSFLFLHGCGCVGFALLLLNTRDDEGIETTCGVTGDTSCCLLC